MIKAILQYIILGSIQDYDDCEELENNPGGGFERKTTASDFNPNKASGILNMITQMQNNAGSGVGELPDYEDSLRNLMKLDQTLQQLDGLLGNDKMGPKYRGRLMKKRLIKPNAKDNSTIRALAEPNFETEYDNVTEITSNA